MKASIEPLIGKYDGTHVTITYRDGFSPEFITFKCEGHGKPSKRQMILWGITEEDWNNNKVVMTSKGKMKIKEILTCNIFYETHQAFLRATTTVKAINNDRVNKQLSNI